MDLDEIWHIDIYEFVQFGEASLNLWGVLVLGLYSEL